MPHWQSTRLACTRFLACSKVQYYPHLEKKKKKKKKSENSGSSYTPSLPSFELSINKQSCSVSKPLPDPKSQSPLKTPFSDPPHVHPTSLLALFALISVPQHQISDVESSKHLPVPTSSCQPSLFPLVMFKFSPSTNGHPAVWHTKTPCMAPGATLPGSLLLCWRSFTASFCPPPGEFPLSGFHLLHCPSGLIPAHLIPHLRATGLGSMLSHTASVNPFPLLGFKRSWMVQEDTKIKAK